MLVFRSGRTDPSMVLQKKPGRFAILGLERCWKAGLRGKLYFFGGYP